MVIRLATLFLVITMATACSNSAITVPSEPVAAVRLSYGEGGSKLAAMEPGNTVQLATVALSANGDVILVDRGFMFISRDPNVATVGANGLLVAQAFGVTRIVVSLVAHRQTYSDSVTVAVGRATLLQRAPGT